MTKSCARRNVPCGPVFELKNGWDLLAPGVFELLMRLSLAGTISLLVLEPPCTTFSLARKPGVRDMSYPEGFYPDDHATLLGTLLGLVCMVLALSQWVVGNEYLFEQAAFGHMRCTFYWQYLAFLSSSWVVTPFCGYLKEAPIYLKPTIFVFRRSSRFWFQLDRPCVCTLKHTQLCGALTVAAAAYPELLCERVADLVLQNAPTCHSPGYNIKTVRNLLGSGAPNNIREVDIISMMTMMTISFEQIVDPLFPSFQM